MVSGGLVSGGLVSGGLVGGGLVGGGFFGGSLIGGGLVSGGFFGGSLIGGGLVSGDLVGGVLVGGVFCSLYILGGGLFGHGLFGHHLFGDRFFRGRRLAHPVGKVIQKNHRPFFAIGRVLHDDAHRPLRARRLFVRQTQNDLTVDIGLYDFLRDRGQRGPRQQHDQHRGGRDEPFHRRSLQLGKSETGAMASSFAPLKPKSR